MEAKDLKIFLVDDDRFTLKIYEQHLKNLFISDVTMFENGNDCLNALSLNPDVIFLDYNMDELNGLDVLLKIKRVNPNIFVVMVSGQESIENAVDVLKYGAFDYFTKGKNEMEKMAKVIDRIIEFKQVLEERNPSILKRILSII